MSFGLTIQEFKKIKNVFSLFNQVDKVIIFGSRALDTYREGSDIDLAIFGKDINIDLILKIRAKLENLPYAYSYDIIDYHKISNPDLKEHIHNFGMPFYEKKEASNPDWKEYRLEDIVENFIDYRGKTPNKTESGIPLVTAKIIKDGRILEPNEFIDASEYLTWMTRGFPKTNDVVLTTEAPLGEVALIKSEKIALGQRLITIQTKKNICDSVFLKYYLQSFVGQGALQARASGSTVEGIQAAQLKLMEVFLPKLSEQQSIAEVLSSLDDKIDLLKRQNKTFEAIAEALFRQWFIEEAEESWEEKELIDVIDLVGGGTPKTDIKEYWDGNINWLAGGDITTNHKGFVSDSEKSITDLGLKKSSAKLLPKYSTVITARGTVGKYCLLSKPMTFSQSNYGIKPKYINCFFFTYLLVAYSVDELQAAAYGSVFDTITTNTFKEHKIKVPSEIVIKNFEETISSYFYKMLSNSNQIRTLTQLRDTLLPKLMSGEVRVEG